MGFGVGSEAGFDDGEGKEVTSGWRLFKREEMADVMSGGEREDR